MLAQFYPILNVSFTNDGSGCTLTQSPSFSPTKNPTRPKTPTRNYTN